MPRISAPEIPAPCNPNVLKIIAVSPCGSRFCGDARELESDKFFENKILRDSIRKNLRAGELATGLFSGFCLQDPENKGSFCDFPANGKNILDESTGESLDSLVCPYREAR